MHRLRFDVKACIGYALPISIEGRHKKPMKDKETVSWQDRKASERFAMISPLLADDIDPAKKDIGA